jgi:hypothetical protein
MIAFIRRMFDNLSIRPCQTLESPYMLIYGFYCTDCRAKFEVLTGYEPPRPRAATRPLAIIRRAV